MTLRKPKGYLLLTLLMISALLSGCGGSSEDENIPYTVEVWNQHSIVFGNNSTVKTAGYNAYGQLGDGTRENRFQAVSVPGLGRITGFSAGATHTLAFTNNSSAMAWGFNSHGQLGNSNIATSKSSRTDDYSATPVRVGSLTGVTSVAAGWSHSLAVSGGKVYSWGDNNYRQLGYATVDNVNSEPKEVPELADVKEVAAGHTHSLALTTGGTVWAWGDNEFGQLGPGANGAATSVTPVEVVFPVGVVPVEIAAGGGFSLARMNDGTVWAWGHNQYGQTGSSTGMGIRNGFVAPVQVENLPTGRQVRGIAAGIGHALAFLDDGTAWAWGFNERGALGNIPKIDLETPSSANSRIPVQMLIGRTQEPETETPITGVVKVQAFGNSSLVTRRNPETGALEIWGWGDNGFGQLGVEREERGIGYRPVPVQMLGL